LVDSFKTTVHLEKISLVQLAIYHRDLSLVLFTVAASIVSNTISSKLQMSLRKTISKLMTANLAHFYESVLFDPFSFLTNNLTT